MVYSTFTILMWRILLLTIGIYLLYRFIFDFFIPVYKASKRVHRQFQDMQQNGYGNGQSGNGPSYTTPEPDSSYSSASSKDKDYIDFEEIKD